MDENQVTPAQTNPLVEQLKSLPGDVLDKIKDVNWTAYPRQGLEKLKNLDWSGYSKDVVGQIKSLGGYSEELVENFRRMVQGEDTTLNPEIEQKILALQMQAIKMGASDIFLASGSVPSMRIDGKTLFLKDEVLLDTQFLAQYLRQVMSESHKKKLEENLEHDFAVSIEGGYRFRVNAFLQKNGISLSFRFIPESVPSFESLHLPEQLLSIADMPSGLVLVTGSTGSGKSTTLAALIDLINQKYQKHILTIEDPIEFVHKNKNSLIEQREVGTHSKSFASSLRSALREAPDVILVGEMRDPETIALALTAAETGSLVFGTLHSNSAPNAINRIIDTFPANQQDQVRTQLAESLRAVVWQTLLPRREGKGRVVAFEVLFRNTAVATMIRENKTYQLNSSLETGQNDGMIDLKKWLEKLASNGDISVEVAQETLNQHI